MASSSSSSNQVVSLLSATAEVNTIRNDDEKSDTINLINNDENDATSSTNSVIRINNNLILNSDSFEDENVDFISRTRTDGSSNQTLSTLENVKNSANIDSGNEDVKLRTSDNSLPSGSFSSIYRSIMTISDDITSPISESDSQARLSIDVLGVLNNELDAILGINITNNLTPNIIENFNVDGVPSLPKKEDPQGSTSFIDISTNEVDAIQENSFLHSSAVELASFSSADCRNLISLEKELEYNLRSITISDMGRGTEEPTDCENSGVNQEYATKRFDNVMEPAEELTCSQQIFLQESIADPEKAPIAIEIISKDNSDSENDNNTNKCESVELGIDRELETLETDKIMVDDLFPSPSLNTNIAGIPNDRVQSDESPSNKMRQEYPEKILDSLQNLENDGPKVMESRKEQQNHQPAEPSEINQESLVIQVSTPGHDSPIDGSDQEVKDKSQLIREPLHLQPSPMRHVDSFYSFISSGSSEPDTDSKYQMYQSERGLKRRRNSLQQKLNNQKQELEREQQVISDDDVGQGAQQKYRSQSRLDVHFLYDNILTAASSTDAEMLLVRNPTELADDEQSQINCTSTSFQNTSPASTPVRTLDYQERREILSPSFTAMSSSSHQNQTVDNDPFLLLEYLTNTYRKNSIMIFHIGNPTNSFEINELWKDVFDHQIVYLPWMSPGARMGSETPSIGNMLHICYAISAWLNMSTKNSLNDDKRNENNNIAIISCPNGKTKTALVSACYLKFAGIVNHSRDGFGYFINQYMRRNNDGYSNANDHLSNTPALASEEILEQLPPSIQTFFTNFDATVELGTYLNRKPLLLKAIVLKGVPVEDRPCIDLWDRQSNHIYTSHPHLWNPTTRNIWEDDFQRRRSMRRASSTINKPVAQRSLDDLSISYNQQTNSLGTGTISAAPINASPSRAAFVLRSQNRRHSFPLPAEYQRQNNQYVREVSGLWDDEEGYYLVNQIVSGDFCLLCHFGGRYASPAAKNKENDDLFDTSKILFRYANNTAFVSDRDSNDLLSNEVDLMTRYANSFEPDEFLLSLIWERHHKRSNCSDENGLAVPTTILQDLSDDVLPTIFRFLSTEALTEGWKTISKYHAGSLDRTSSSSSQFDDVLKSFFQSFHHIGSPNELREKCPNYVIDLALSLSYNNSSAAEALLVDGSLRTLWQAKERDLIGNEQNPIQWSESLINSGSGTPILIGTDSNNHDYNGKQLTEQLLINESSYVSDYSNKGSYLMAPNLDVPITPDVPITLGAFDFDAIKQMESDENNLIASSSSVTLLRHQSPVDSSVAKENRTADGFANDLLEPFEAAAVTDEIIARQKNSCDVQEYKELRVAITVETVQLMDDAAYISNASPFPETEAAPETEGNRNTGSTCAAISSIAEASEAADGVSSMVGTDAAMEETLNKTVTVMEEISSRTNESNAATASSIVGEDAVINELMNMKNDANSASRSAQCSPVAAAGTMLERLTSDFTAPVAKEEALDMVGMASKENSSHPVGSAEALNSASMPAHIGPTPVFEENMSRKRKINPDYAASKVGEAAVLEEMLSKNEFTIIGVTPPKVGVSAVIEEMLNNKKAATSTLERRHEELRDTTSTNCGVDPDGSFSDIRADTAMGEIPRNVTSGNAVPKDSNVEESTVSELSLNGNKVSNLASVILVPVVIDEEISKTRVSLSNNAIAIAAAAEVQEIPIQKHNPTNYGASSNVEASAAMEEITDAEKTASSTVVRASVESAPEIEEEWHRKMVPDLDAESTNKSPKEGVDAVMKETLIQKMSSDSASMFSKGSPASMMQESLNMNKNSASKLTVSKVGVAAVMEEMLNRKKSSNPIAQSTKKEAIVLMEEILNRKKGTDSASASSHGDATSVLEELLNKTKNSALDTTAANVGGATVMEEMLSKKKSANPVALSSKVDAAAVMNEILNRKKSSILTLVSPEGEVASVMQEMSANNNTSSKAGAAAVMEEMQSEKKGSDNVPPSSKVGAAAVMEEMLNRKMGANSLSASSQSDGSSIMENLASNATSSKVGAAALMEEMLSRKKHSIPVVQSSKVGSAAELEEMLNRKKGGDVATVSSQCETVSLTADLLTKNKNAASDETASKVEAASMMEETLNRKKSANPVAQSSKIGAAAIMEEMLNRKKGANSISVSSKGDAASAMEELLGKNEASTSDATVPLVGAAAAMEEMLNRKKTSNPISPSSKTGAAAVMDEMLKRKNGSTSASVSSKGEAASVLQEMLAKNKNSPFEASSSKAGAATVMEEMLSKKKVSDPLPPSSKVGAASVMEEMLNRKKGAMLVSVSSKGDAASVMEQLLTKNKNLASDDASSKVGAAAVMEDMLSRKKISNPVARASKVGASAVMEEMLNRKMGSNSVSDPSKSEANSVMEEMLSRKKNQNPATVSLKSGAAPLLEAMLSKAAASGAGRSSITEKQPLASGMQSQTEEPPIKDDPKYQKYFKMRKMGLSDDAIRNALVRDQIDQSLLDLDPERSFNSQMKEKTTGDGMDATLNDDPTFSKYFKMRKMGLPDGAIKNAMERDGVDPSILDLNPNQSLKSQRGSSSDTSDAPPLKDDPTFSKYFKMRKMGLPDGAIKNAMERDGVDSTVLDLNPEKSLHSQRSSDSKGEDGPPLKNDPTFQKYFKMLQMGLPSGAVKNAMDRDGVDATVLDLDPERSLNSQRSGSGDADEGPPLKDDPTYQKYFKMRKMGLPDGAIKNAMDRDGLDSSILDLNPEKSLISQRGDVDTGIPLKDDPAYQKYFKMRKMGLPDGAIANAMDRDGVDPGILNLDPEKSVEFQLKPKAEAKTPAVKKKKVRRKKIYWNPLEANQIKEDSLWSMVKGLVHMSGLKYDEEEFAELFTESTDPKDKNPKKEKNEGAKPKKAVQVIDGKRSMNGGIILQRLKMDYKLLATMVDSMDAGKLDSNSIKGLKELLPTLDEKNGLLQYMKQAGNDDKAKEKAYADFAEAEKYMYTMLNVTDAESKFDAMLFRSNYLSRLDELIVSIKTVEKACDDIRNSNKLRSILAMILTVVNQINTGGEGNEAQGFTLDALMKLSEAKAFDKKTSVLHYVVRLVQRNDESLLDVAKDIVHTKDAELVVLDSLCNDMKALKDELVPVLETVKKQADGLEEKGELKQMTAKELREQRSIIRNVANVPQYNKADNLTGRTSMERFAINARESIDDAVGYTENVKEKFLKLLEYFGEDAGMQSNDFFGILTKFMAEFDKTIQHAVALEKMQKKEQEKLRLEKEKQDKILAREKEAKNTVADDKIVLTGQCSIEITAGAIEVTESSPPTQTAAPPTAANTQTGSAIAAMTAAAAARRKSQNPVAAPTSGAEAVLADLLKRKQTAGEVDADPKSDKASVDEKLSIKKVEMSAGLGTAPEGNEMDKAQKETDSTDLQDNVESTKQKELQSSVSKPSNSNKVLEELLNSRQLPEAGKVPILDLKSIERTAPKTDGVSSQKTASAALLEQMLSRKQGDHTADSFSVTRASLVESSCKLSESNTVTSIEEKTSQQAIMNPLSNTQPVPHELVQKDSDNRDDNVLSSQISSAQGISLPTTPEELSLSNENQGKPTQDMPDELAFNDDCDFTLLNSPKLDGLEDNAIASGSNAHEPESLHVKPMPSSDLTALQATTLSSHCCATADAVATIYESAEMLITDVEGESGPLPISGIIALEAAAAAAAQQYIEPQKKHGENSDAVARICHQDNSGPCIADSSFTRVMLLDGTSEKAIEDSSMNYETVLMNSTLSSGEEHTTAEMHNPDSREEKGENVFSLSSVHTMKAAEHQTVDYNACNTSMTSTNSLTIDASLVTESSTRQQLDGFANKSISNEITSSQECLTRVHSAFVTREESLESNDGQLGNISVAVDLMSSEEFFSLVQADADATTEIKTQEQSLDSNVMGSVNNLVESAHGSSDKVIIEDTDLNNETMPVPYGSDIVSGSGNIDTEEVIPCQTNREHSCPDMINPKSLDVDGAAHVNDTSYSDQTTQADSSSMKKTLYDVDGVEHDLHDDQAEKEIAPRSRLMGELRKLDTFYNRISNVDEKKDCGQDIPDARVKVGIGIDPSLLLDQVKNLGSNVVSQTIELGRTATSVVPRRNRKGTRKASRSRSPSHGLPGFQQSERKYSKSPSRRMSDGGKQ